MLVHYIPTSLIFAVSSISVVSKSASSGLSLNSVLLAPAYEKKKYRNVHISSTLKH